MKKGILIALTMLFALAITAQEVWVGRQGKKYHHKENCGLLAQPALKMTQEEAKAKGLTPCGICVKEEKKEEEPAPIVQEVEVERQEKQIEQPEAAPSQPDQQEAETEDDEMPQRPGKKEKTKWKDYEMPRDANGKIYYSEVVSLPNYSKDELFLKAQEWAVKTFVSSKQVVEVKDKEAGKIIAKAYTPAFHDNSFWKVLGTAVSAMGKKPWERTVDFTDEGSLWYVFSVDVKDGRYRIVADQFVSEVYGADLKDVKKTRKWGKFKKFANDYIVTLFAEFKEFMSTAKEVEWMP